MNPSKIVKASFKIPNYSIININYNHKVPEPYIPIEKTISDLPDKILGINDLKGSGIHSKNKVIYVGSGHVYKDGTPTIYGSGPGNSSDSYDEPVDYSIFDDDDLLEDLRNQY